MLDISKYLCSNKNSTTFEFIDIDNGEKINSLNSMDVQEIQIQSIKKIIFMMNRKYENAPFTFELQNNDKRVAFKKKIAS